ncbi:hypothetical protein ACWDTQ_31155 [Streptomyces cellulosae]
MTRAFDFLLKDVSQDASRNKPRGGPYRIRVSAGGHAFTGQVVGPARFREDLPGEERLRFGFAMDADEVSEEAGCHLHLLAEHGPGITPQGKPVVRFWLTSINAWWVG